MLSVANSNKKWRPQKPRRSFIRVGAILKQLETGKQTLDDIAKAIKYPPNTIYVDLVALEDAGKVDSSKRGRFLVWQLPTNP